VHRRSRVERWLFRYLTEGTPGVRDVAWRLRIALSRDACCEVLRLLQRLLSRRRHSDAYHGILRFPDSTESRWFSRLPARGTRIRSQPWGIYRGKVWVVEEVLQSGRSTYTIFLTDRSEYLDRLRHGAERPDLADELLELARHTGATVNEQRRWWRHRRSRPYP
jgi:hypothetical protein